MSTSLDAATELSSTPHSSKKRKVATGTPEKSKKKRKHEKLENGAPESQEIVTSKKDKKKKNRGNDIEITEELPTAPDDHDIELPDIPVNPHESDPVDEADNESLVANGIGQDGLINQVEDIDDSLMQSAALSCFYEKRLSLQLPVPAISLAMPTSSLLALHLAPLLLSYFPPAEGIVLSFSDPVLSAQPRYGVNLSLQPPRSAEIPRYPPGETFARCADGFGVCWVWLTVTLLVFRPGTGDQLKGWANVISEGFVGLVSYNYFQTAVGKTRIPKAWTWDGPTRESSKSKKKAKIGRLRDEDGIGNSQETLVDSQNTTYGNDFTEGGSGSFVDASGNQISANQTFKVVDVEMVPGHEKDKLTLQIDGSLLTLEEEAAVMATERQRFEQIQNRSRSRSKTPGLEPGDMPIMSGALSFSRETSPS